MHKRNTHAESTIGVQVENATEIIEALTQAYYMEIESVVNYAAASINLDGVRAKEIKEALKKDIEEEMRHARKLGKPTRFWECVRLGSSISPHRSWT